MEGCYERSDHQGRVAFGPRGAVQSRDGFGYDARAMNPPKHARGAAALLSAVALFTIGALCTVSAVPATAPAGPAPLVHAHAHNDYEHARPLLDALDNG